MAWKFISGNVQVIVGKLCQENIGFDEKGDQYIEKTICFEEHNKRQETRLTHIKN